ncbi:MAG: response regulator [Proteobacteria bacterium]|nr:response regulator [Pseudomonadota bacterium]
MSTLLLVDDNEMLTRASRARLKISIPGLKVVTASSYSEALREAEAHCPDIMVIDNWLPDGDGFTLRKKIQAKLPNVQIIMISAYWVDEDRKEAESRRTLKVLDKPFKMDELVQVIREALAVIDSMIGEAPLHNKPQFSMFESRTIQPKQDNPEWDLNQLKGVMIVDDSEMHANMCATVFAPYEDCRVEFARNGLEALELLELGSKFDLIILEADMPKMDGISSLKEMHRRKYGHLPVIVTSTRNREEDIIEALKAGAWGYVTKPWKSSRFRNLIARVMSAVNISLESLPTKRPSIAPVATFDSYYEKSLKEIQ